MLVVVDHQHPLAAQMCGGQQRARLARRLLQAQREPEGGALARGAFDPDAAAHQLRQALGNREPQARAPVAARGRAVGLLERMEQAGDLLRRQADAGVAHGAAQQHIARPLLQHAHADRDLAVLGELDRVVGKVDQDLTEPQRVTDHPLGHRVLHVDHQLQTLGRGLFLDHVGDAGQHLLELEVDRLYIELAGLDLGEVQHVVQDAQQVAAGAQHLVQVVALARVQSALGHQLGHAEQRVHRGAYLVAHVGQELRFHARGVLRGTLGALLALVRRHEPCVQAPVL
ncbi:hypothetical protein [Ramlibacter sp. 2FC]|uniref:hypothetical protein n=1 Tax=Ramlibacter sp. 2FC TaxID=2502188 RepID=UPI00201DC5FF|nr:hypothetical protein [Ramlibacter sp. 2FC]